MLPVMDASVDGAVELSLLLALHVVTIPQRTFGSQGSRLRGECGQRRCTLERVVCSGMNGLDALAQGGPAALLTVIGL